MTAVAQDKPITGLGGALLEFCGLNSLPSLSQHDNHVTAYVLEVYLKCKVFPIGNKHATN